MSMSNYTVDVNQIHFFSAKPFMKCTMENEASCQLKYSLPGDNIETFVRVQADGNVPEQDHTIFTRNIHTQFNFIIMIYFKFY